MKIEQIHLSLIMPSTGTVDSAGYDLHMPEAGVIEPGQTKKVLLGFASEVPKGYAALLMPRSGAGSKGISLANTIGLIDADYRGEWMAALHLDAEVADKPFHWEAGDRLLQFVLIPIFKPVLWKVSSVQQSDRGTGGFGSTGK